MMASQQAISSAAPALQALQAVVSAIKNEGAVSDRNCRLLYFLAQEALIGASEILDNKQVKRIEATSSGRSFFLVASSSRKPHLSIPGFCSCAAFRHKVASHAELLVCKHELAVMLAEALGMSVKEQIDDEQWAQRFSLAWALQTCDYGETTS